MYISCIYFYSQNNSNFGGQKTHMHEVTGGNMVGNSRPTTPSSQHKRSGRRLLHRSSGVYSILPQSPKVHYPVDGDKLPLGTGSNLEKFEYISDGLDELDVNMTNLQQIHEAISDGFNESFASFLYGLSITMWCVDFPGCPSREQWEKLQAVEGINARIRELEETVRRARDKNAKLKEELLSRENVKPLRDALRPKAKERVGRPIKPTVAEKEPDDTYTTNESSFASSSNVASLNIQSRIPQPARTNSSGITRASTSTKRGPNLNQPPRYMRGLFDSVPAKSFAKPARGTLSSRVSKLSRPPFR